MATLNTTFENINRLMDIKHELGAKNLNETIKALLGLPYTRDKERSFNSKMISVDKTVHQEIKDRSKQHFTTMFKIVDQLIADYDARKSL